MEVINVYPEYDGKGYEEDIHKYTFQIGRAHV